MGDRLIALASAAFPDLNDAEQAVIEALAQGEHADLRRAKEAPEDGSDSPGDTQPVVRSKLLRWLCVDAEAGREIDPRGIGILGATISGRLDLDSVSVAFPLALQCCNIPDGIDLQDAETQRLDFVGSHTADVNAFGIVVRGSVRLCDGFQANGAVVLKGASIRGDLDCSGGRFLNRAQEALQVEVASIGGDVSLHSGFAQGRISLFGATITGTVDCGGGRFLNRHGIALYLSRARIGGNVFLRDGLRARGEVRLHGTSITGNLECQESRFCNRGRTAILADGLKVGGRAFLSGRFVATGEVSFVGCSIGGDFNCAGGRFFVENGPALRLDQAKIGGDANLCNGFLASGEVGLYCAAVTGDLNCCDGRFVSRGGRALFAGEAHIGANAYLARRFQAEGEVNLQRAVVGGDLNCTNGRFVNPGGYALIAGGARVDGAIVLVGGFIAVGKVNLGGAAISGDLDCRSGRFVNRSERALILDGARIDGSVVLGAGFQARGEVALSGATIHGDIDCRRGHFYNYRGIAFNGDQLVIDHHGWLSTGFRTNGLVKLTNGSIGTLDVSGARFFGDADNGLVASNTKVSNEISWTNVGKTSTTQLNLAHASIGTLEDDETSWPTQGRLHIEGFVYNSISGRLVDAIARLKWLDRQPTDRFSPQPYEQLARVLRRAGYEAQAKRVAMGAQDARRKLGGLGFWTKLGNVILKLTIGYGYEPHRALLWSLGIVVILGFVFDAGYARGLMAPTKETVHSSEAYQRTPILPESHPAFNGYVYSLDTFLPIVNLRQKDDWQPNDHARCTVFGHQRNCGFILRLLNWAEILVGWVLTTLGIAGLTGLVRRV